MRTLVRVLALGLLLAAPLVAVAYPFVPQPELFDGWRGPIDSALRVVKRRNAEPVPFDLKYLPVHDAAFNGPRGVVAIRPCELFDRPGGDRLASALFIDNGMLDFVKGFVGLRSMAWPPPYKLDMILCRVELNLQPGVDPKHGRLNACANSLVLRTREPYDWLEQIARILPPAERRIHRDRVYHTVRPDPRIPLIVNGEPIRTGIFIADSRTVVIDAEDYIKTLIDHLAEGKPTEQPAGWEKVNHGVIAVALSNPDKRWARYLPERDGPRLPRNRDWEYDFLDDLEELVVGLDARPTTQFYLSATARDPFAGKRLAWNAKRLLSLAEAHLGSVPPPTAEVIRALWTKGRFTPTFRGFEISADAGTDLVGPLLDRHTPPPRPEMPRQHLGPRGTGGF